MLYRFFVIAFFSVFTISCQKNSQNSLLGDYAPSSNCPNGGCATTTINKNAVYISVTSAGGSQIDVGAADKRVDIGGECFDAGYAKNIIQVFYTSTGTAVPFNAITANTSNQAVCKDGRFNISIPTTVFGGAATVAISLKILVYDTNGILVNTGFQSQADITLGRLSE